MTSQPDSGSDSGTRGSHTPGRWLTSTTSPVVEQQGTGRVVALCDVGSAHGQFRIIGDEAMANARLIAAAPDLLAALQELVEFADKMTGRVEPEYRQLAYAREAIAKAGA